MNVDKLLYTRREAASVLGISVRSVDYMIARKELKTRRIGRKVLIPAAEVRRFAACDHFGPVGSAKANEVAA